jgi:hypothetical protein
MAEVFDDVIADLHLKKKSAIEMLDFETAQYFYEEIGRVKEKRVIREIEDVLAEAVRNLQRIQARRRQLLEDLAEYGRRGNARLYSKFEVLFEETQDDHIHQLMDLEKERGLTLIEESEREIPEQIQMLEDAKQSALEGNFAVAIEMRQRARVVGEEELENRRLEVEENFAKAKNEMLARHQTEMDQINESHEEELNLLREEAVAREEEVSREFALAVSLVKHRAQVECEAISTDDKAKKEAFKLILTQIDESTKEFDCLPEITAKLTKTERMRLTELCPAQAAMNPLITDIPDEDTLRRRERIKTAIIGNARTGLGNVPQSSTGLISRAFTVTQGKR